MPNELDFSFHTLSAEQTDALLSGIDSLPLDRAAVRRIRRETERAAAPRRLRRRTAARLLVPAAACLAALILACVCFPQAARALAEFLGFEFRASRYMLENPETRSPAPAVEEAIANAACRDVGYSISLLNEWEDADTWAGYRAQMGLAPFSEEDWAFLRNIEPRVAEVFYDGHTLIWNTYMYADEAVMEAMRSVKIDMLAVEGASTYTVEGDPTVYPLYIGAHGLPPVADGADHGVFFAQVTGDPDEQLLPDGIITVTQVIRIAEGDAMIHGAAVARLTHTFTFDATPGNAASGAPDASTTALSGEIDLTMDHLDAGDGTEKSWTIDTRRISLDGVTLGVETSYHATGIYVHITPAEVPEGWTQDMTYALLRPTAFNRYGKIDTPGVAGELYVNGERVAEAQMPDSGIIGELTYVLPIFPQDYDAIGTVVLRLSHTCYTELNGADLIGGEVYEFPASSSVGLTGTTKTVPLAEIPIPIP